MKPALPAMLTLALMAGSCGAARADDDSKETRIAAAMNMIEVCGEREQFKVFFDKTADLTAAAMAKNPAAAVPADQMEQVTAILHTDLEAQIDAYAGLLAASYADHLSTVDIDAIAGFCRTPAGQDLARERSKMEFEAFDVRQLWMKNAINSAMQDAMQKTQGRGKTL